MDRYLPRLSEDARRWVRFGALAAVIVLGLWLLGVLGPVLTPLAAALAIAYIVNPVVTWLEEKRRIPRVVSALVGLLVVLGAAGVLIFVATVQLIEFAYKAPDYVNGLTSWLRERAPSLAAWSVQPERLRQLAEQHGASAASSLIGWIGGFFSNALYIAGVAVLLPMYAFFFVVGFNTLKKTIHEHLPTLIRPTLTRIWTTIDSSIANFFRGRLVVAACVGTLSGVGWLIVGVPYNLAFGMLAGVLNLVPFLSVFAVAPVLILTYVRAAEANESWVMPVLLAMGVVVVVQAIESFALSPLIESKSSGLHPVTTVIALSIGGQLAGLLGMLLSIPLASTIKSLSIEYLLPEIRRLADHPLAHAPVRLHADASASAPAQAEMSKADSPKESR